MLNWLYENYGIYPTQIHENQFRLNQQSYELIDVLEDEQTLLYYQNQIDQYGKAMGIACNTIIRNRMNQLISYDDNKPKVLLLRNDQSLPLEMILDFHLRNQVKETLDMNFVRNRWIEKCDRIESEILGVTIHQDHDTLMSACSYALGFGENAIAYLKEMIKSDVKISMSLTSKRMESRSSYYLLNPLLVCHDHPMRDFSELLKRKAMNVQNLDEIFMRNHYSKEEMMYLVARLLFPTTFFDELEGAYMASRKVNEQILLKFREDSVYIISIVRYLTLKYYLRPIEWIIE